jgi:hypothetical protein
VNEACLRMPQYTGVARPQPILASYLGNEDLNNHIDVTACIYSSKDAEEKKMKQRKTPGRC